MTRKDMIEKLTKHELTYLLENPDTLDSVVEFFMTGGYHAMPDVNLLNHFEHFFADQE